MDLWWGKSTGGTFPSGEGMSEFLGSGGGAPPFPQVEEILLSLPPKKKVVSTFIIDQTQIKISKFFQ